MANTLDDASAAWKHEGLDTGKSPDAIGTCHLSHNSTTNVTWTAGKNNNAFTHTTNSQVRRMSKSVSSGLGPLDVSDNAGGGVGLSLPFTLSIWQKLSVASYASPTAPMSPGLASLGSGQGINAFSWALWREYHAGNYASVKFATAGSDADITVLTASGLSFGDSNWHHYVISKAAGNGHRRIYYDGVLVNELASVSHGIQGPDESGFMLNSVQFTNFNTTAIYHCLGQMDETYFWSRELEPHEVTKLYNAGAGAFHPFSADPAPAAYNGMAMKGTA